MVWLARNRSGALQIAPRLGGDDTAQALDDIDNGSRQMKRILDRQRNVLVKWLPSAVQPLSPLAVHWVAKVVE